MHERKENFYKRNHLADSKFSIHTLDIRRYKIITFETHQQNINKKQ